MCTVRSKLWFWGIQTWSYNGIILLQSMLGWSNLKHAFTCFTPRLHTIRFRIIPIKATPISIPSIPAVIVVSHVEVKLQALSGSACAPRDRKACSYHGCSLLWAFFFFFSHAGRNFTHFCVVIFKDELSHSIKISASVYCLACESII